MIDYMKSKQNKNLVNPESALFLIPILIGIVTSFAIGLIAFRPLLLRSNQYLETWKSYEKKKSNLKAKYEELKLVNTQLRRAENQKSFIIQLIAGTKDLKALFAILNKVANQNNITIVEIEPYQTINYLYKNNNKNNDTFSNIDQEDEFKTNEESNFPLITKEIEQHNALISIKGYFYQIKNFLRDIESLENIIVAKGIDLKKSEQQESQNPNKLIFLNLKTVFSAYGRLINKGVNE